MSLTARFTRESALLRATVAGTIELSDVESTFASIVSAAASAEVTGVLVDLSRVGGSLTTPDKYEVGTIIAQALGSVRKRILPRIRVAFYALPPLIDPARFGETVARNRGANVKGSSDLAELLEWLGANDGSRASGPAEAHP